MIRGTRTKEMSGFHVLIKVEDVAAILKYPLCDRRNQPLSVLAVTGDDGSFSVHLERPFSGPPILHDMRRMKSLGSGQDFVLSVVRLIVSIR